MKRRLLIGLLLVATLLSLRPVVLSYGIEHTWIPGIYDAGDLDAALAVLGAKAIDAAPSPRAHAADLLISTLPATALPALGGRNVVAGHSRAPPLL